MNLTRRQFIKIVGSHAVNYLLGGCLGKTTVEKPEIFEEPTDKEQIISVYKNIVAAINNNDINFALKAASQDFFKRRWEVATPTISLQRAVKDADILEYRINSIDVKREEDKKLLGIVKNQRKEYLISDPDLEEWYTIYNGKLKQVHKKIIETSSEDIFIKTGEGWKYYSGSLLDFYEKH